MVSRLQQEEAIELEEELDDDEDADKKAAAKGSKLVVAEEVQQGHVSWKAMSLYLTTLSPWPIVFWVAYLVGRTISECAEILGMQTACPRRLYSCLHRDVVVGAFRRGYVQRSSIEHVSDLFKSI
jgi:hypothetical protein